MLQAMVEAFDVMEIENFKYEVGMLARGKLQQFRAVLADLTDWTSEWDDPDRVMALNDTLATLADAEALAQVPVVVEAHPLVVETHPLDIEARPWDQQQQQQQQQHNNKKRTDIYDIRVFVSTAAMTSQPPFRFCRMGSPMRLR